MSFRMIMHAFMQKVEYTKLVNILPDFLLLLVLCDENIVLWGSLWCFFSYFISQLIVGLIPNPYLCSVFTPRLRHEVEVMKQSIYYLTTQFSTTIPCMFLKCFKLSVTSFRFLA